MYPDPAMRLSALQVVAVEAARGWRLAKDKQSHRIDSIVALGMAALAAARGRSQSPATAVLYDFGTGKKLTAADYTGLPTFDAGFATPAHDPLLSTLRR